MGGHHYFDVDCGGVCRFLLLTHRSSQCELHRRRITERTIGRVYHNFGPCIFRGVRALIALFGRGSPPASGSRGGHIHIGKGQGGPGDVTRDGIMGPYLLPLKRCPVAVVRFRENHI